MQKLLLIAAGGAVGSVVRYALAGWVQKLGSGAFPVGTLVVNLSGCLAIGFLGMVLTGPWLVREEYRVAILIGILGGYTTFSAFGRETYLLVADGQWTPAIMNVVLSNGLGLIAVWFGHRMGQKLFGV